MPCLILYNLKRPCVNIKNHLVFAFEILWYLPQVLQAVAASAVLEFTGFEYISCFIQDVDFRPGYSPAVLFYEASVLLACLAEN